MYSKELLLFDMDGVLLTPGGYHRALQDTVAYLARCVGYSHVALSQEQIHAFEGAGITNEWDSAAICFAFLVDRLYEISSHIGVDESVFTNQLNISGLNAPDFDLIIDRIESHTDRGWPALTRAKSVLPERVGWILDQAYQIDGLTQRVQQEHVLGSAAFEDTYGIKPLLGVSSYLSAYDCSNLSAKAYVKLRSWLEREGAGAAIFTNRPSKSPGGETGTPEAELGAEKIGLVDLPLAATGGITWLEALYKKSVGTFNKPHPVHALAALRCAVGEEVVAAFQAAGRFVDGKAEPGEWAVLNGARAWVFEDSTGGIASLRIARSELARLNIQLDVRLVGIAESPVKQKALRSAGASVYPTLEKALISFFGSQGL